MGFVVTFALLLAYTSLLGLATTGSRARRVGLVAFATCTLAIPFALRGQSYALRGLVAFPLLINLLRVIELAVGTRPVTPARRALHGAMLLEMRWNRRLPPAVDLVSLVRLLGFGGMMVAAFFVLARVPDSGVASGGVRWFAAVVASYTAFDAFCAYAVLQWTALGFEMPRLHDHPIKSRSVGEFWGERWNRIIGGWLRSHCFMPLARRGHARLGLTAAFSVSMLLHVYLAWAVLDAHAAMMWGIFFGLQVPIVFAERALGVTRWPRLAARVWTIGILAAASPFFVEPVLRAFEAMR